MTSLALSPDGSILWTGSWDKTIKKWDTKVKWSFCQLNAYLICLIDWRMYCYFAWTYRFRQITTVGWLHTLFGLLRHPYTSMEHWNKWMHCHAKEAFTCDWKLSCWYAWSILVCCFFRSLDIQMGDCYQQLYRYIWSTWHKCLLRTCVGWWNVDCIGWQDCTSMEYRGMWSYFS